MKLVVYTPTSTIPHMLVRIIGVFALEVRIPHINLINPLMVKDIDRHTSGKPLSWRQKM
jgi:hypothetical protein